MPFLNHASLQLVYVTFQLEPVINLSVIKEEAVNIGMDIVHFMSSVGIGEIPRPISRHYPTLRQTVDDLSQRCEIPFLGMAKKVSIGESGRYCRSFWVEPGWLAKYCVENNIDGTLCDDIGETVGSFVAENLSDWIA